ncbi:DUF4169 family protein [Rhodalgimonas zhirmunskyi]|uniref:DUF4169 family protein n=1 Tax=Rhodalgimonas zhirmunskyi TaxID=2964767 RepID=A0AAJ1U8C9_9RHOB|nr:DUF4169 family protein [Rhodoalgimonas zhirmunskyi]MDQ2095221.1 DUF4169 family protein [Rhodoalgimonas zhirmunskyi]
MGDVVNLNQARKLRQKSKARAQADENTVKFGRTKAEKALEKAKADKARSTLDAHKRDDD